MADNKLQFEVSITGNGEQQLRKLTSAITDMGNEGSKSLDKFSGAFNVFAGVISAEAVLGGVKALASAAAGLFQTLVVDGVNAAIEAQDAITKLNAALVASGQYSETTSQELQNFAGALQQTTKFSDDAIISAQSLIQSIAQLDKDALKGATTAAVDLASALGMDLESAASLVAKAAEGNTSALSRYGIQIRKGATDAQTFANALEAINSKFGGSAAAQLQTFSGAVALLKNTFGDAQEEIGNAIIKNQSLINAFQETQKIVEGLKLAISGNKDELAGYVSQAVVTGIHVAKAFFGIGEAVVRGVEAFVSAVNYLVSSVAAGITGFLGVFSDSMEETSEYLANVASQNAQAFKDAFTKEGAIDAIQAALDRVGSAAEKGIGKIAESSPRAAAGLRDAAVATNELSEAQLKLAEEGVRLADQALQKNPQAEYEARIAALDAAFVADQEFAVKRVEAAAIFDQERQEKEAAIRAQRIQELQEENNILIQLDEEANKQRIDSNNLAIQEILRAEEAGSKNRLRVKLDEKRREEQIGRERLYAVSSTLDAMSSLQFAKSKELAAVGKSAAITQAIIDTYRGASGAAAALAGIPFVGPALAAAAAAAFTVAGFARVQAIRGTPLATGITEVPAGFPNDTFQARLTTGERVVDRGTNQDLKSFLGGSGQMVPLLGAILNRLDNLENNVIVNVGNRTIIEEVRYGLESGRVVNA